MIDRREFIVALGATGLLAACQSGPPKPSVITVNVTGGAGMNPGPGGGDRPVTVLVMRLIYLPYDLVNYLAGFLRVPYRPFILASIFGSLPGTLTFVLAGASLDIDDIFAGNFSIAAINPWTLVLSLVLFVGGLAVSRLLRRKEGA